MSQNARVPVKHLLSIACCLSLFVSGCEQDRAATEDQGIADSPVQPLPALTASSSRSGPGISANAPAGRYSPAAPQAGPISARENIDQRLQHLKKKDAAIVAALDEAYASFWEVYEEAAATGETSRLAEVLAGQALQDITGQIQQRKEKGRGVDGRYDHDVAYARVTLSSADVIDRLVDRSVYIDLTTGQRLPRTRASSRYYLTSRMQKIDGVWKVVSLKYESEPR